MHGIMPRYLLAIGVRPKVSCGPSKHEHLGGRGRIHSAKSIRWCSQKQLLRISLLHPPHHISTNLTFRILGDFVGVFSASLRMRDSLQRLAMQLLAQA